MNRIVDRLGLDASDAWGSFPRGAAYGACGRAKPPDGTGSTGPTESAGAAGRGAAEASARRFGEAQAADAETVIYRLEEAGMTLLALPSSGHSTRLRTGGLDFVREAAESYGWSDGRIRPAVPSAAKITRMDEALGWVRLIPGDRVVLRRIVGARSLVSPVTERHLFSWRRVGTMVGADHKAVQRWHAQGVDLIVGALR